MPYLAGGIATHPDSQPYLNHHPYDPDITPQQPLAVAPHLLGNSLDAGSITHLENAIRQRPLMRIMGKTRAF